jgi:thioredoxin-dependent peroxiredoxin
MLNAGDKAPDFKVKDHLGEEWTLAKLKGKNAVIWFYPKADTPG